MTFQNRWIDSTYAYINSIINNQEDSHSNYFSLSMFNTGAMVITDDTNLHFTNSFKCVSFTLLCGHCIFNSKFSTPTPISGQYLLLHHEDTIQAVSILQHHDMVNHLDKHTLLPLVFFLIFPTYYYIFYIVIFNNIILIWINILIFCIVSLDNLLFRKKPLPLSSIYFFLSSDVIYLS